MCHCWDGTAGYRASSSSFDSLPQMEPPSIVWNFCGPAQSSGLSLVPSPAYVLCSAVPGFVGNRHYLLRFSMTSQLERSQQRESALIIIGNQHVTSFLGSRSVSAHRSHDKSETLASVQMWVRGGILAKFHPRPGKISSNERLSRRNPSILVMMYARRF